MRQFLAPALAFILTTTLVVAAPHPDFSSTDQETNPPFVANTDPNPTDINNVPEELAFAEQIRPVSGEDAAPLDTFNEKTTSEDGAVTELASNLDPEDYNPIPGHTDPPSQTTIIPETPAFAPCASGWYGLYSCSGSEALTKTRGMLAGAVSMPFLSVNNRNTGHFANS